MLTGAAARISQEVALFDKLREPRYQNLTLSEDDTLLCGFSSGSLNLAAINACFRKKDPCSWDNYYKESVLFPLTSSQVFNAFPILHLPIYSTHPLRDTLEDFLRNTQMTYTRDLLFQSYILTMADRTRDERSDQKKWETLWACSRNPMQENLYLADLLMSSTAIPVAFPSQEIYGKPGSTTDFPTRKFYDGGTGGTFARFEDYLGSLILQNGPLDELYIISPMREKSEEEIHLEFNHLFSGLEALEIKQFKDFLSSISMKTFMKFLVALQQWGQQHFPMAKHCYVCIPEMESNFKILDFDNEKPQYQAVCKWVDQHPDRLAIPLDQFIKSHQNDLA